MDRRKRRPAGLNFWSSGKWPMAGCGKLMMAMKCSSRVWHGAQRGAFVLVASGCPNGARAIVFGGRHDQRRPQSRWSRLLPSRINVSTTPEDTGPDVSMQSSSARFVGRGFQSNSQALPSMNWFVGRRQQHSLPLTATAGYPEIRVDDVDSSVAGVDNRLPLIRSVSVSVCLSVVLDWAFLGCVFPSPTVEAWDGSGGHET